MTKAEDRYNEFLGRESRETVVKKINHGEYRGGIFISWGNGSTSIVTDSELQAVLLRNHSSQKTKG